MKKNYILWLSVSAFIMLVLPWMAVTFANGDSGMAVCFLLFYGVNPIYSVIIGGFAGKDMKHLWSLPVISAVLFLAGTWMLFDMGEPDFMYYAAVYFVFGVFTMLFTSFIKNRTAYRQV